MRVKELINELPDILDKSFVAQNPGRPLKQG